MDSWKHIVVIRFFILAYGQEHIDLFDAIAWPSLMQPRNKAAIPRDCVFSVYSDAASMAALVQSIEIQNLGTIETHVIDSAANHYNVQVAALMEEMRVCAANGDALVIVNPDCLWGDGSLANLLTIAGEQNVCIASPHVRVDQKRFLLWLRNLWLETNDITAIDNPQLVVLAMNMLHPSWMDADISRIETNTFYTGISLQRLSDGLYAIGHLLPTIFYAKPTAADYAFFAENRHVPGLWDHHWPERVVESGRYRTITSSDAVCIVELTKAETHSTPLAPVDRSETMKFCRSGSHIALNRAAVAIWSCKPYA